MNDELLKTSQRDEIESALYQMGSLKALGPDEYDACFYQTQLDIVGDDVVVADISILNGDTNLVETNYTYIVLILKG